MPTVIFVLAVLLLLAVVFAYNQNRKLSERKTNDVIWGKSLIAELSLPELILGTVHELINTGRSSSNLSVELERKLRLIAGLLGSLGPVRDQINELTTAAQDTYESSGLNITISDKGSVTMSINPYQFDVFGVETTALNHMLIEVMTKSEIFAVISRIGNVVSVSLTTPSGEKLVGSPEAIRQHLDQTQ